MKNPLLIIISVILILGAFYTINNKTHFAFVESFGLHSLLGNREEDYSKSPLSIEYMQRKEYPGSKIIIEDTLSPADEYNRYFISYLSDGLKINGLLTIPTTEKPKKGYPVVLLNHGYVPPDEYSATSNYEMMVEPLARAGFIVLMPNFRGHGESEGKPEQPFVSPGYITDSMNALASVKTLEDVDKNSIGVFGHSTGGFMILHQLLLTDDFKAAVISAGVVGNKSSMVAWHLDSLKNNLLTTVNDWQTAAQLRKLVTEKGTPESNPEFWNATDPTLQLDKVNTPIQIQIGTADIIVPPEMSSWLHKELQKKKKTVEYLEYEDADHNLAPYTEEAMGEAVTFFNKYLK